uniref:Uncharacterized protein n=1 Tax=Oryza brachyantha TaxID=4533 RepID=J3LB73_ORYBR
MKGELLLKAFLTTEPGKYVLRGIRLGLVEDDSFILDLEPLHGILLGHPVLNPNAGLAPTTTGNTVTSTLKHNIEVHSIDTC